MTLPRLSLWTWGLFGLHFVIFLGVNLLLNPHPDMVDHWIWGQFLSFSYYEHPPMIAVLFRGLTLLLGDAELGLEVGAQLVNLLVLAGAYGIARHAFGPEAGLGTLLVLCGMPYFTVGSIFLHITQPFMLSWLGALFCWIQWQQTRDVRWLWGIGVAAGLGALSKYIMILFYLGMMLHFLVYREQRSQWLNWRIYAAGALSLLIFTPVLWWNAQNDWISFRWQLSRGTSGADFGENTLDFTVGHWLLFSPIWFAAGVWVLLKLRERLRDGRSPESAIALLSLFPLVFFTLMSLKGSIADPHWANLAYLGLAMLLGRELASGCLRPHRKKLVVAGLALNVLSVTLLVRHTLHPLYDWAPFELKNFRYLEQQGVPESVQETLQQHRGRYYSKPAYEAKLQEWLRPEDYQQWGPLLLRVAQDSIGDRFTSFLDWPETGAQLQAILQQHGWESVDYIVSREYQISSALAYWVPQRPRPWPHSLEKPERNQWSPRAEVLSRRSVFVCDLWECQETLEKAEAELGRSLEYWGEIVQKREDRLVRNFLIYRIPNQPGASSSPPNPERP